MGKEVVSKSANALADYDPNVLGAADDIAVDDLKISRVAVMSSNSELVKQDICKQGQIIDLETHEVLGYKSEKPLEVIVLKSFKYWVQKRDDKFIARVPGKSNKDMPWQDGDIQNIFHHAFLVVVPSQIKDGCDMPYELTFRSTDLPTAQKLSKMIWVMARKKQASWNKKFLISAVPKKNDKHSWWGTDIKVGEDTSNEEKKAAYSWFQQVNKNDLKFSEPQTASQGSEETGDVQF